MRKQGKLWHISVPCHSERSEEPRRGSRRETLRHFVPQGDISRLLFLSSSSAFDALLEVLKIIHRQLSREWHEGMYEILEYDSELELKDPAGNLAELKRRQKVRFLQDNIIAYEDQAWGEGEIFADYQCSPGVAVDRYRDGFKWKVLINSVLLPQALTPLISQSRR